MDVRAFLFSPRGVICGFVKVCCEKRNRRHKDYNSRVSSRYAKENWRKRKTVDAFITGRFINIM